MIIADLLDLSRLETPAQRFEAEDVDCKRFLLDLQARFAEALERKGLHWDATREPADLRNIRINPQLLRLALDNLVDNAIKFTDAGGHVAVNVRTTPDEAIFEVRDDGCGIPADEQQRVFERFYQVERPFGPGARQRPGPVDRPPCGGGPARERASGEFRGAGYPCDGGHSPEPRLELTCS